MCTPQHGCQKAPATINITGYFTSFAGYNLLVKRENVGGQWCCNSLSTVYFLLLLKIFLTTLPFLACMVYCNPINLELGLWNTSNQHVHVIMQFMKKVKIK